MHLFSHMNKTIPIAIAVALLIGGGAGYLVGGSQNHPTESSAIVTTTTTPAQHGAQSSMLDDLKGKSGDSLDAAFLDGMIVHHQQAIDMANIVLERTTRPEIKQMAQDIISVQTKEIETMQGWIKAWFGR